MRFKNRWRLYEFLNVIKKGSFYNIRFYMGWSKKKLRRHINKLIKEGFIKEENGIYYPISKEDLKY